MFLSEPSRARTGLIEQARRRWPTANPAMAERSPHRVTVADASGTHTKMADTGWREALLPPSVVTQSLRRSGIPRGAHR